MMGWTAVGRGGLIDHGKGSGPAKGVLLAKLDLTRCSFLKHVVTVVAM